MHSRGLNLYESELAVKVDVPIDGGRGSGVARGDSQLPPVWLPMGVINRQVPCPHGVLEMESKLPGSWRGVNELDWLQAKVFAQQLAATCGWIHLDLHQCKCGVGV